MQQSASPNEHAAYVFLEYVEPRLARSGARSPATPPARGIRNIAIVAHSAGGMVTAHLVRRFPDSSNEHPSLRCSTFQSVCAPHVSPETDVAFV